MDRLIGAIGNSLACGAYAAFSTEWSETGTASVDVEIYSIRVAVYPKKTTMVRVNKTARFFCLFCVSCSCRLLCSFMLNRRLGLCDRPWDIFQEKINNHGIEMMPLLGLDFLDCLVDRPGSFVRSFADQSIPDIYHCENSGGERDFFSFEMPRIAVPIPSFVMMARDIERRS